MYLVILCSRGLSDDEWASVYHGLLDCRLVMWILGAWGLKSQIARFKLRGIGANSSYMWLDADVGDNETPDLERQIVVFGGETGSGQVVTVKFRYTNIADDGLIGLPIFRA